MKKIVFYLAHPAHFHLFKNIINELGKSNVIYIIYNDKDVLHQLIKDSSFERVYRIKTDILGSNKFNIIFIFFLKLFKAFFLCVKIRPHIIIGTSIIITFISWILRFKSVIVNEDDFDIIKYTSFIGYFFADHILCPNVCRTTYFDKKCVKYNGYHELAYLSPKYFKPNKKIILKYIKLDKPIFLLRFAKLEAHHDINVKGIDNNLALKIINYLKSKGMYLFRQKEN